MKKYLIFGIIAGVIIFIIFVSVFLNYGGNSCDQPPEMNCDCFCCHMFGLRGYESCSLFGALLGMIFGVLSGYLIAKRQ